MQHKGIMAAGVFAGLLIISMLALGFGNLGVAKGATETIVPVAGQRVNDSMAKAWSVDEWQQYSAELEQTLRIMQEREAVYRSQIDLANQTILQLQDQLNAGSNSRFTFAEDEHGEHESHE